MLKTISKTNDLTEIIQHHDRQIETQANQIDSILKFNQKIKTALNKKDIQVTTLKKG